MKLRSGTELLPGEEHEDNGDGPKIHNEHSHHVTLFGRTHNRVVLITHFNICLYATAFFIQIGMLPYLSKQLGADPVVFGYIQTTFAITQLAGGPLFGRFGDLYGSRAALTVAFISASLTYGILSFANSIPLLFLSRMPSLLMHAMQGAQMVVTDLCDTSDRASALGRLGVSYGIGMVIGPFTGGLLVKYFGESFSVFVSFLLTLVSIALTLIYIPGHTRREDARPKEEISGSAVFNLSKILSLLKHPEACLLLFVKGLLVSRKSTNHDIGVPIGIFQSMFAVVAMETFQLPADQNGYIMSFVGIIAMITQGGLVSILVHRLTEMGVLRLSAVILIFSYLMLAFIQNLLQLYLSMVPLCIGLTLMSVVIGSALTKTVSDTDTGTMLGINMGVNSLIRTVSPTAGGLMFNQFGFPSFGYLGALTSVLVTVILFVKR